MSHQGMIRDITEHLELSMQLQQAQKMEAIGTLAGGIAHDFNNIIFAMTGFTELALEDLPAESQACANLGQVLKAATRAGEMVEQILAFSHRTHTESKPLDLSPVIKDALKFLRAAIPSTIDVRQRIEPNLGMIYGDTTQIHQILMNLCTNAAHAMKETKGVLSVELITVEIDIDFAAAHAPMVPGKYIKMTVADTGRGIPPEFLDRIFEPYFTTKKAGEGTGLGLSVAHGIVTSHGGAMTVCSDPGKGTTFNVFLPVIAEEARKEGKSGPDIIPTGDEKILLVDDEPLLVEMEQTVLERLGYTVVTTTSSVQALDLFREDSQRFDLMITDLTMPGLTGVELAAQVKAVRSEIPIILSTGFSQALSESELADVGIEAVVHKPILKREIAKVIRRVLDSVPPRKDMEVA